jgi:type IV pilus assembly protein PilF
VLTLRRASLAASGLALAAVLGGCVQTTTTTRTDDSPRAAPSDPAADAERRASVRLELAGGYFSRGQFDTALEEIRLALVARPDLGAAYNMRGLIYAAMGELRLAEDSFLRALAINPRDADAMNNRGWFLCQQGRYDEADALFDQALSQPQYRDHPRTLAAQGVCLTRAGKLPAAEQKLLRSYEVDPTNPNTAFNLADVLYRRGDYERARFYIRRVNDRDEVSNAPSLWLAARIEHRAGNRNAAEIIGRQLRARFPQSRETLAMDRGRFDD